MRVEAERDEYKKLASLLREEMERLKRGLVGPKRERLVADNQLTLGVLATALAGPDAPKPEEKKTEVKSHKRAPHGRKAPENLPRVRMVVQPEEVQRAGLDAFECIGEETSEVVERRLGGLVVVETVRPKYVPKNRVKDAETQVSIAPTTELPIVRGLAGPTLLAETIVNRWGFHLPAHRQEEFYRREGFPLARSTVCEWHINLSKLCDPLLAAMWKDALEQRLLMVDATGVLVQNREACRRAHFWVVVAPGKHVLFRFTARHTKGALDSMLAGFGGYLVADAHTVYDHLYTRTEDDPEKSRIAVECGCWAHVRRYFFKALDTDPDRAKQALERIGKLFELEREWKKHTPQARAASRKEHAEPVVKAFYAWVEDQVMRVLEETPISRAFGYALNQRVALRRFLEDGEIPLHNNESERQLRREAVGRKNWLFVGSDDGAQANATFTSLIASCQLHKLDPTAYLRDLFCLLPNWPHSRVLELAPAHWSKTTSATEVSALLEKHPFRRVSLGLDPLQQ